jgi:hypothetical protein
MYWRASTLVSLLHVGNTLIIVVTEFEEEVMDTKYFLEAMQEWEKRTGKKCIMSNVDTPTFSELLRIAQQKKEEEQNGRKNS